MTNNHYQTDHQNLRNYSSKQDLKDNQPKKCFKKSIVFGAFTFVFLISSFFTNKQNFLIDYKMLNYTKFILISLSFSSAIISTHFLIQLKSLEDFTNFLKIINKKTNQEFLKKNEIMLLDNEKKKSPQGFQIKPSTKIFKREVSSSNHNFSKINNHDL